MMRCDCADDADNASSADDAHFWSNAFVASCIDDEHVVSFPNTVINDLCRNERHAFKQVFKRFLCLRSVCFGKYKLVSQDVEFVL